MEYWEKLYLKEAQSWIFQGADPGDVACSLLVGLGVAVDALLDRLTEKKRVGTIFTGQIEGLPFSVTALPAGALQVESLVRALSVTKAKYIIGIGATGGLQEEVEMGDIILPDAAVRDEGMSNYYYPPEIPAVPDYELLQALVEAANKVGGRYHVGLIWSVAAQLRETEELIQKWNRLGVLGVECETAALFMLARFCGFKAGVVLAVSDSPFKKQSHELGPEFDARWKEGWTRAMQIAIEAAKMLPRGG